MEREQDQQRNDPNRNPADDRPRVGTFTGDSGSPAGGEQARDGDTIVHPGTSAADQGRPADPGARLLEEHPGERGRDVERTALDGAPGIPAAGDEKLEDVLNTPDSDLGGAVAGQTKPAGDTSDRPSPEQVRREDRERNTL